MKLIYINVLLCILLLPVGYANAGWIEQESGVTVALNDVCFVDSLHGWAAGDSSTIISTVDGGDNWVKQVCPLDSIILAKVIFLDENYGYISGYKVPGIFATTDRGNNWEFKKIEMDGLYSAGEKAGISFINKDEGWITASFYDEGEEPGINWPTRKLIHTTDGGKNWEILCTITGDIYQEKFNYFRSIVFTDSNSGWALGGGQPVDFAPTDIFKSTDGGKTWQIVSHTSYYGIYLQIAQPDTLWMNGLNIAYSFDGGSIWLKINSQYYSNLVSDFKLVDGKTAWTLGHYETSGIAIKYTEDGGNTFEGVMSGFSTPLYSIEAVNNTAWAIGVKGKIVKCQREITSDVSEQKFPEIIDLEQNKPNPFNPSTNISFSINEESHVTIEIYNISGQKIETLLNEQISAGKHSIVWNAGKYPAGIYVGKLSSGNIFKSIRMTLVK